MTHGIDLAAWAWISMSAVLALVAIWMGRRAVSEGRMRKLEQSQREEVEAYTRLNPALAPEELPLGLAKRVCAAVAQFSAFRQVAMLLRDSEGRLNVVGSAGVDTLMAQAINAWVARFARERHHWGHKERETRYAVTMGPTGAFDPKMAAVQGVGRQVIMLPLWSEAGEMLGALAVWTAEDGRVLGKATAAQGPSDGEMLPLEMLAQKLSVALDVAALNDRVTRAEKVAGLGNLAKELHQPLTAVMGFAELIAETATEPRVREDAVAIVGEAMRMKESMDALFQYSPKDAARGETVRTRVPSRVMNVPVPLAR